MSLALTLLVLVALLAVTVAAAGCLRWLSRRPAPHIAHEVVQPERLGADGLGSDATLLQFSRQPCSRCTGAHRTLAEVARSREGVRHFDIDLTHRPDIARHFGVLQTPTTLVLDGHGAIQTRFGGVPRRDVVELEVSRVTRARASL